MKYYQTEKLSETIQIFMFNFDSLYQTCFSQLLEAVLTELKLYTGTVYFKILEPKTILFKVERIFFYIHRVLPLKYLYRWL